MAEEHFDTKAAASYLDVADNTLEKWRVYGTGPRFYKLGRKVRYRRRDLDAWIESRLCSSTSEGFALDAPGRKAA